jgi:hypothetical protein
MGLADPSAVVASRTELHDSPYAGGVFWLVGCLSTSHIYGMTRKWKSRLVRAAGYIVLAMSATVIVWMILSAAN